MHVHITRSLWHISWWSNANLQQLESCFNCLGLVKHWSEVQIKDLRRQAGTSAKCCRLLFQLGTDYRCGPIHLMRLIRLSQPIHPHVIAVILFSPIFKVCQHVCKFLCCVVESLRDHDQLASRKSYHFISQLSIRQAIIKQRYMTWNLYSCGLDTFIKNDNVWQISQEGLEPFTDGL